MKIVRVGALRGLLISAIVLGFPAALILGRFIGVMIHGQPVFWLSD